MTIEQIKVAELAAAKKEAGQELKDHIGHCAQCGNARDHRRTTLRCPRGKELAGVLILISHEYARAMVVLREPYPGQLTIDEAIGKSDT